MHAVSCSIFFPVMEVQSMDLVFYFHYVWATIYMDSKEEPCLMVNFEHLKYIFFYLQPKSWHVLNTVKVSLNTHYDLTPIMTSQDVWTVLAVRLYLFIGTSVKAFRFACPMLPPCESTQSKRAEDNPMEKKKLMHLVSLAFDITRVSRRSRTSELHMLPWKQHGENLCQVRLWGEFKSKVKNKYVHLPKRTTKCLKGMDKFHEKWARNLSSANKL